MTKTNAKLRLQDFRGSRLSAQIVPIVSREGNGTADPGSAAGVREPLLAETAHDLNNALGSIRLHLDLLELECGNAERVRQRLQEVRPAIEYATDMARQLVSPEPLAAHGKGNRPVRATALNPVLERMLPLLSVILPKGVELNLSLDPDLGPVGLDPSDLIRIVSNLVLNSSAALRRDKRPGKARVMIQTGSGAAPGWVRLRVRDTGVGMSAKTKARIFEPFFTTGSNGQGAGLGLSGALRMVRRAGGSIEVHSALGKGTDVIIELPCAALPARKDPQRSRSGSSITAIDTPENISEKSGTKRRAR